MSKRHLQVLIRVRMQLLSDLRYGKRILRMKGSITVFLALVFLIILSLIMVSLEMARTAALRACAQLALSAGFECVASDFYRPLFDEYGLYALNLGFGDRVADVSTVEHITESFLTANLEFGEVDSLSVTITQMLTDYNGEVFIKQAVETEQATVVEYAVTGLLQRLGAVVEQEQTMKILERKTEVENELALIDIETLKLMKIIDGVDISTKSLFGSGQIYRIADQFVKEFMTKEPNAANTCINNPALLDKLTPFYQNPLEMIRDLRITIGDIRDCQNELARMITAADAGANNHDAIVNMAGMLEGKVQAANSQIRYMENLCGSTLETMKQAQSQISAIDAIRSDMRTKVMQYEEFLLKYAKSGSDELKSNLTDSLNEMKSYVGLADSGHVTDYSQMLETLEADIEVLSVCGDLAALNFSTGDSDADLDVKENILDNVAKTLAEFSYTGLCFDYSGLMTESAQNKIYELAKTQLRKSISERILDFLVPSKTAVSDAEISTGLFPDITTGSNEADEQSENGQITNDATEADELTLSGITGSSGLSAFASIMKEGLECIYDKTMLTLYTDDKFSSFTDKNRRSDRVLQYEQEFVIAGNASDKENLTSVALQIALLRMIPSAVFTFTNESTTKQARTVANATVGVLGMPFLTAVAQSLILLVWAAEQAIVETAALLDGRRISIITGETEFCINFAEIPLFTADLVRKKVEDFKNTSWGLVYDDYLKLLLLIRSNEILAERELGLVQENIRYAYDEDFIICNCATGLEVTSQISCKELYLSLFPRLFSVSFPDRYSVKVSSSIKY